MANIWRRVSKRTTYLNLSATILYLPFSSDFQWVYNYVHFINVFYIRSMEACSYYYNVPVFLVITGSGLPYQSHSKYYTLPVKGRSIEARSFRSSIDGWQ